MTVKTFELNDKEKVQTLLRGIDELLVNRFDTPPAEPRAPPA